MIKIYTDSAADFSRKEAEDANVGIIPLKINFGDNTYFQEDDDGFLHFFEMLKEAKTLPTTSQASPADYMAVFEEAKKNGDSVIAFTISSGLSSSVLSAQLAKDTVGYDNVYIIDSLGAVAAQRILVHYATMLRDQGLSAKEIAEKVLDARPRVRLRGFVDTLEYLHKGGRLSRGAAIVGSVLNIKPIIILTPDGKLGSPEKARGLKGAIRACMEIIEKDGQIDTSIPVMYNHVGPNLEQANIFRDKINEKFGYWGEMYPVGGIVGTHTGPGAMAITYILKKKDE